MTIFKYKGFDVELLQVRGINRAVIACEDFHRVLEHQPISSEREEREVYRYTAEEWKDVVEEIIDHYITIGVIRHEI